MPTMVKVAFVDVTFRMSESLNPDRLAEVMLGSCLQLHFFLRYSGILATVSYAGPAAA